MDGLVRQAVLVRVTRSFTASFNHHRVQSLETCPEIHRTRTDLLDT